jgi:hypothetical protein
MASIVDPGAELDCALAWFASVTDIPAPAKTAPVRAFLRLIKESDTLDLLVCKSQIASFHSGILFLGRIVLKYDVFYREPHYFTCQDELPCGNSVRGF